MINFFLSVHNLKCLERKAKEENKLSKEKANNQIDLIKNEMQRAKSVQSKLKKEINNAVQNKERVKAQLTGPSLLERFEHYKRYELI